MHVFPKKENINLSYYFFFFSKGWLRLPQGLQVRPRPEKELPLVSQKGKRKNRTRFKNNFEHSV